MRRWLMLGCATVLLTVLALVLLGWLAGTYVPWP